MGHKAFKRVVTESEHSLYLLYALDTIGLCSKDDFWPLVAQLGWMDYIPYCELITQLTNSGEISSMPAGTLYVGEKGRATLRLFKNRVPVSVCEQIELQAHDYLLKYINHKQVSSGYEGKPNDDLSHMFGRYYEGDIPVLLMKMATSDRDYCSTAVSTFPKILPQLLMLFQSFTGLSRDELPVDEAPLEHVDFGKALLHPHGNGEYAVAIQIASPATTYRFQLLFENKEAASGWAFNCMSQADKVTLRVESLFRSVVHE